MRGRGEGERGGGEGVSGAVLTIGKRGKIKREIRQMNVYKEREENIEQNSTKSGGPVGNARPRS